jgi:O-antigen/teichoic acid export membrane protein
LFLAFAPNLVWITFHDPKTDITPLVPMLTNILRYGAFIILFDSLAVLPFAVLRLEHAAKKFASLKLLNIVVTLVLNFLFILVFKLKVEGIFLANLASSLLILLLLLPTIRSRFEWRYARGVMKKLLPFGLTNVPAYLGAMMVQVIDRPIVQAYLGLAVLGIYQANYRMGFTMMVFVSLFEYAWRPFFLKESRTNDERARQLFSRVFTYFMLIALVGCLFLSFALPYVVSTPIFGHSLLRRDYLAGISIIPVVLFAYVFQGMYTNFIAGIYIKEHNKVLPFITGLGALVNVAANLYLIPRIGIMGAALATLLAYMAMAGAIYREAQKVYFIKYDWRRVGLLFAVVLAAYGLDRLLTLTAILPGGWPSLISRVLISAGTIIALYATGFFSANEIRYLKEMATKLRRGRAPIASLEPTEPVEEAKQKQEGA